MFKKSKNSKTELQRNYGLKLISGIAGGLDRAADEALHSEDFDYINKLDESLYDLEMSAFNARQKLIGVNKNE